MRRICTPTVLAPTVLATLAFSLAACASPTAVDTPLPEENTHAIVAERAHQVALPTGDVVNYSILPSGRATLTVDEAPRLDERPVVFVTEEAGEDFWFYPSDARGYVNTGILDRGFFNIPAMATLESVPVVLVYGQGMDAGEIAEIAGNLPGARSVRALSDANSARVEVDAALAAEFWQAVVPDIRDGSYKGGIERVMLDQGEHPIPDASASSIESAAGNCGAQGLHELTVEGIRRDGQPAAGSASLSSFQVLNVDDASIFSSTEFFTDGVGVVCVPTGRYSVLGLVNTYDPDLEDIGFFLALEWVMVGNPEVEVNTDVTIVLDAGDANEITFETPEPTERIDNLFRLQWNREAAAGGGLSGGIVGISNLSNHPAAVLRRFAAETAPVSTGEFELLTDARLVAAGEGAASPVFYDLAVVRQGHIPADLHYVADPGTLVTVVNRLHSDVPPQNVMKEIRHFWRPWQQTSFNSGRDVQVQLERTEFLVGGDTRYQQRIDASGMHATIGPGRMDEPETIYGPDEPRARIQTWFKRPMRPGVREIGPNAAPVVRDGNTLVLLMPEWVDAHPGHFGFRHTAVDTTAFRLFRDGELITSASRPRGNFPMVPEPAEYRMELDVERDAPWQMTSVRNSTAWTFRSQHEAQVQVLPLMLLDYEIDLELGNNTTPTTTHLDITARYQAGAVGSPPPRVRLWISRDDGATWEPRHGQAQGGGRFRFPLEDVHAVGGFVSLRAEAFDSGGNRIEQEIIRAYAVPESIPPPCPPNCPDS